MLFHRASFSFFDYRFILLVLTIIAQIFSPIAELITPLEILTKEAKAEMEIK